MEGVRVLGVAEERGPCLWISAPQITCLQHPKEVGTWVGAWVLPPPHIPPMALCPPPPQPCHPSHPGGWCHPHRAHPWVLHGSPSLFPLLLFKKHPH